MTSQRSGAATKMPRDLGHSRVRRRLFEDEVKDQAAVDNCANILQEIRQTDSEHMMMKWNFDFANERPLEGDYLWYRKEKDIWVGMIPEVSKFSAIPDTVSTAVQDELEIDVTEMGKENETTPRKSTSENAPAVKKRRLEVDRAVSEKRAKRKISL